MADMEGCLPGGTRPNTPHHHMGLSLQATVQMRLCRGCAQGGVWWKRGGGRAGARQGRTAQNSGRMFVFAATLVPRRRDIRHGNVGERENLNPRNHREDSVIAARAVPGEPLVGKPKFRTPLYRTVEYW